MTFDTTEQAVLNEPEKFCADALAELFLGETARPGDEEPRAQARGAGATMPVESLAPDPELEGSPIAAAAPHPAGRGLEREAGRAIEAILAGHLPIMASAWVSQYARGVAQKGGAVGLVRAAGGHLSVEVFGDSAACPPALHTSAADAVAALCPTVGRWLIQADPELAGALLDRGEIDRLTLLCSADEASLVAGYRTLKELLEPRIELQAPVSSLHIAIAGRADAEAMAAAERLSRAAERFLGIDTTVAVGAARIESGASATWFEGEAATPELLSKLADIISEGTPAPGAAAVAHGEEARGDLDSGWPAIFGPAFDSPGLAAHEPAPNAAPNGSPGASLPPANGLPAGAPIPAREVSAEAAAARPASLAIQCPRAPAIEFRIEGESLVAIADARAESLDGAVRQLMIASAWAAENHALIAMATGRPGALAPPQRVLLVEDAAAARSLLDADIRIRACAAGRAEIPLN